MLRLFRHIRQRLFLEGKVSRYLGYAIGEIVLIVVGILIALELNNWNEARAEEKVHLEYINQLIQSIEGDLEELTFSVELNSLRLGFAEFLFDLSANPDLIQNRGVEFMVALGGTTPAEPPLFSDTFDELQSTGNLRLLGSELKMQLFEYYQNDERSRQYSAIRQNLVIEWKKELRRVLSYEQERFLAENGIRSIFPAKLAQVQSMSFDEDSIFDALERFRNNLALVGLLPELRAGLKGWRDNQQARIEEAEELLLNMNEIKAQLAN